jgi:ATP-dependent DNA helicase RecG
MAAGIHLDSPIAAVLGGGQSKKDQDKRAGLERLGLRTVGDLLLHFPRKYVDTGKLTQVDTPEEGQMLTVVGEVVDSKQHTYSDRRTGRPAFRVETTLRTDGPPLKMTFFYKKGGTAAWQVKRLSPGA